jgi:predicted nucleic acid-binding protein
MLYIDTCVLLAVLSVTELHSALGLKVRTKALSQAQAEAVLQGFERSLAPGLLMLELEPQDFRNANACLRGWTTTLRAADALHLAIASGRGATLCSLDAPFVAAAQQLGLNAQLLEAGVPPSRSSPL